LVLHPIKVLLAGWHHVEYVNASRFAQLDHHLEQGSTTLAGRPDVQGRANVPRDSGLVELSLDVVGVGDGVKSVVMLDAMLVRALGPSNPHPCSVLHN